MAGGGRPKGPRGLISGWEGGAEEEAKSWDHRDTHWAGASWLAGLTARLLIASLSAGMATPAI